MRGWGGGCIWRKDFTSLLFVNQSIINFVLVLIYWSSKRERPTIDWSKLLIISFESSGRPGWGPASSTLHSTASWWLKGGGGWFAAFLLLSTKVVNESSHGWRASLSLSVQRGGVLSCGVLLHSSCKKEHPLPFLPRRCAKKETSNDHYVVGDFSNLDGHLSVSQNLWRHFFSPLFFIIIISALKS